MKGTMSAEAVARQRERDRQRARERRRDPVEAARMREAVRRYRERVKRDPAKLRARREADRIRSRLRAERRGLGLEPTRRHDLRQRDTMPDLPALPLVAYVDRLVEREGIDLTAACERLGVSERNVHAWRVGERWGVAFDVADRALTRGGALWWDVWPEDCPEAVRAFDG